MASKNVNEYLEEVLVSSDFEDSGSSDWEPYKIHGNILAYDTDDEETNHKIITSSHNNIKVNHNINKDISVISNTSSSYSDSEEEVHKRKKKKNEETWEKNKRRQNRNSGAQYNSVNGKIIEDGKTKSQIDHIIIDKRHKTSIRNIRSYRGADGDIDHYLVVATFALKLSVKWRSKIQIGKNNKLDIEKIKNPKEIDAYQRELSENLRKYSLAEHESDNVTLWSKTKESLIKAAERLRGKHIKQNKKHWFNLECQVAIYKRSLARQNMMLNPTPENVNEYSKKCRSDKEGFKARTNIISDNSGNLISDPSEIVNKFQEFFEELLNNKNNRIGSNNDEKYQELVYHTAEPELLAPNIEEIEIIIKSLKNNKSPGDDNINSELLKIAGREILINLHQIITNIWNSEKIVQEWSLSVICPIFKKGDPTKVDNYRGISLLDAAYKVLSIAILRRIEAFAIDIVGKYQCGFTKGRSTSNHIFTLRQTMEKYYEFDKDLHMIFIDFKQAYDSVNREQLWIVLQNFGLPKKLVNLIKSCNSNTTCKVRFLGRESGDFEVKSGLRQGDALSPILFNIALERVVRDMHETREMDLNGKGTLLAYADNIVILGDSQNEVEARQYERRTNADIERIFNGPNIQKYLVSKRLEWAGYIWRDKGSVMRQVLVSKLYKTRPRGRPRQRWLDRVKKDLIQVDETARIEDADNRDRWKGLVEAAKGLNGL
ncbi:hypothetical protein QTP88_022957 [Uroleucon formosanum]